MAVAPGAGARGPGPAAGHRLRVATRGSSLARLQADLVVGLLRAAHGPSVEVEAVVVQTEGDRRADVPIERIGGQGVFVREVQAAVLDGRADLAVHSAKDLPSSAALRPAGLALACVPARADPRDALVGTPLAALPAGALVATGSVRRRAQLANLRPDLTFTGLRGNVDTRLRLAAGVDAVVVAAAALVRLGRDEGADVLDPSVMLPQVGQGALAVECREGDEATLALLAALEDASSRRAVDAERAFLALIGGGCDLPVGALASAVPGGPVRIEGLLASFDGRSAFRQVVVAADPDTAGAELAAALLEGCGGAALLAGSGPAGPGPPQDGA